MNYGAGEPLDELKVQFCLLHRHQKRKTVLFIFNLDETARQTTRIEPVGKPYREVCLQTLL